jgi:hypothetical protein
MLKERRKERKRKEGEVRERRNEVEVKGGRNEVEVRTRKERLGLSQVRTVNCVFL